MMAFGLRSGSLVATCAALAILASKPAAASEAGKQLWRGGTIITMDGESPRSVEAVVVADGHIQFAGKEREARRIAGTGANVHDLRGRTMLPGFIDAHSHFAAALQSAGWLDLRSPDAPPASIAELQRRIADHIRDREIPSGQWVILWQYDQETLAEKRHISRKEIDAVAPDHPVIVLHVSLHGLVANSAAMQRAGIGDDWIVPEGGIAPRDTRGLFDGTMFEKAMEPVMAALPKSSPQQLLRAIDEAQTLYLSEGFTHAQDGYTQSNIRKFLTSTAAKERLKLDLVLLPGSDDIDALAADPSLTFGRYDGRVKLQGIKITLDGSPQARTAFFTRDYARGSPTGDKPWRGKPNISSEEYLRRAQLAHDRGWQLFVHANGDAAIDMAIAGFDALGIRAADDRRPIVIHSQFMRPDQLKSYARIGVGPAFFTNHSYYRADTHRSNFEAAIVDHISPMASAQKLGLIVSNHSDYSVTPLDTRFQLWSAMARTSKSGVVSGADQRLTAYQALQALTTGPAWQIFEEDRKGRIKPGLLADFVILDRNPLKTPVAGIRDIKVMETVKEGQSVWRRAEN